MIPGGVLKDTYNRTIRDLRISITDRCNFRCAYCLPDTEEAANFFQSRKNALMNAVSSKKLITEDPILTKICIIFNPFSQECIDLWQDLRIL